MLKDPQHIRYLDIKRRNRMRKVPVAFLRPNPEHLATNPKYLCPKGPGLRGVKESGEWCELNDYTRRRYTCGDLVDADPDASVAAVEPDEKPAPVAEPKPKGARIKAKVMNEPAPVAEPDKE